MTTTDALETTLATLVSGAPTPANVDIDMLARHIARDGTSAHNQALGYVADAAEAARLFPGAVAVLRDVEAPEAAQARAFQVIARRWEEVVASTAERIAFDRSFADLAAHWSTHQQLRSSGDIEQLARSGARLDELRSQARHRTFTAPETTRSALAQTCPG